MTASTAQTLNFLQSDLSYPFIIAGLSIFYLATAVTILRDGADSHPAHLGLDHGGLRRLCP